MPRVGQRNREVFSGWIAGLGTLGAVHPPVGFGVGSVPARPSLVHLTTSIEAVAPGQGGGEA